MATQFEQAVAAAKTAGWTVEPRNRRGEPGGYPIVGVCMTHPHRDGPVLHFSYSYERLADDIQGSLATSRITLHQPERARALLGDCREGRLAEAIRTLEAIAARPAWHGGEKSDYANAALARMIAMPAKCTLENLLADLQELDRDGLLEVFKASYPDTWERLCKAVEESVRAATA